MADQSDAMSLARVIGGSIYEEMQRLRDQRDELLAALKLAVRQNDHDMLMTQDELRICRAAIKKAEGAK
jgi:hypothetical protein